MNLLFFNSIHKAEYMLSLYDRNAENVIVYHNDNPSLTRFLEEFFPGDIKIQFPYLLGQLPQTPGQAAEFIKKLKLYRDSVRDVFSFIRPGAKAYVNSWWFDLQQMWISEHLAGLGLDVFFVDTLPEGMSNLRIITNLSLFHRLFTAELGRILNNDVFVLHTGYFHFLGISCKDPVLRIKPRPWATLADEFGFGLDIDTAGAVLIVDNSILDIAGIDIPATQRNLVGHFREIVASGGKIHLKQHPSDTTHSFTGTELEPYVTLMPKHYPVQLMMHRYSDKYFTISSSIAESTGNVYNLFNLLVFNSEETRSIAYEHMCCNSKKILSNVKFV